MDERAGDKGTKRREEGKKGRNVRGKEKKMVQEKVKSKEGHLQCF